MRMGEEKATAAVSLIGGRKKVGRLNLLFKI